ncbi:unnamed protein product, partial [Mesorhabditis belari]|uniref:Integrase catalytic domain-containing protein n=1 Tax=Mesorhabditis belari TaxID=2138241 RepID=A0AAF3JB55_9BILA
MGFGQISVQYLKSSGDDWIDSDINTTLSNVQEVKLQCHIMSKWEKYKKCFVKIHFVRSFHNRFDDPSPSDNGREFANKMVKELVNRWSGCQIVHGRPRHSQSQGSVERANQDVERILCTQLQNPTFFPDTSDEADEEFEKAMELEKREENILQHREGALQCQKMQASKMLEASKNRYDLDQLKWEEQSDCRLILSIIGTKNGILQQKLTRNQFEPANNNFITAEEVPHVETSFRAAVGAESLTGSQVNLDKWKSIQVNGCVDCDFLVDFSFRVCNEVPNGQEGHYTDLNIVICKDPYPFTINGKPPLNPHCEWRALILDPMGFNTTWDDLYSCSYRLNGEKRLIVRAVSQKVSQNGFAFSFRVRQWVNESIPMFVLPDESRCINSSPYEINGERPEIKDWEIRYTSRRVYFLLQARLIKESRVYLGSDADLSATFYGGYSFRVPNTTLDETNFFFLPVNDLLHMREFGFRFAESPRGTWFLMVLEFDKVLQLRKFRGDHGNRSCEYQIVNGPPSNFLGHPELLLNTYRDTDVFQEQSLTSPSYSIYIPPGCAPSIAFSTYSMGTDPPLTSSGDDWIDSDVNTTLFNVQEVKLQCHIMSKWEKYKRCFVKIHFVRSFHNRFDDPSPKCPSQTLYKPTPCGHTSRK